MIPMKSFYMLDEDWEKCEFFKKTEAWGRPEGIRVDLVRALERFRKHLGVPISVNCGTQGIHCDGSCHYIGEAVDCWVHEIHVVDAFLEATRFPEFSGIGLYPWWNRPGLHLDIRHVPVDGMGARWMQDRKKNYVALTWKNISSSVHLW